MFVGSQSCILMRKGTLWLWLLYVFPFILLVWKGPLRPVWHFPLFRVVECCAYHDNVRWIFGYILCCAQADSSVYANDRESGTMGQGSVQEGASRGGSQNVGGKCVLSPPSPESLGIVSATVYILSLILLEMVCATTEEKVWTGHVGHS